ncbi:MAG: hypothetical protein CMF55_03070 [Legionellales bacterium]|nr:hypothetical protein [Legionellales bacterium]HAG61911.1 hypothetical protein [Coxiellaceae bacterium]
MDCMINIRFRAIVSGIIFSCTGSVMASTLLDAYHQSLNHDSVYMQAQAEYMSQKEATKSAWSAFFPRISASGDLLSNHSDNDIDSFAVNGTQTVFNWSAIKRVSKAQAQVRQAVLDLSVAQQDLMQRVVTRYLDVVRTHEIDILTKEQVDAVKQQMEAVKERYRLHHATVTDLDRIKASYDLYRSQLVTADIQLHNAQQQLIELTGAPIKHIPRFKSSFKLLHPQPNQLSLWLKRVTQQNLSIQSASEGVAVAKAALGESRGGYFPVIGAKASYYPTDPEYVDEHFLYELTVDYDGFQGGAVSANVASAMALYQKSQAERQGVYNNAMMLANSAFSSMVNGISQIKAEKRAVESNASALKNTSEGYNAGNQTLLDVIDQQTNLYNANIQYVAGRVQYLSALSLLEQQAGTLKPNTLEHLQGWFR